MTSEDIADLEDFFLAKEENFKEEYLEYLKTIKCSNDANGDGDCHLCYKHGGCLNYRLKLEMG